MAMTTNAQAALIAAAQTDITGDVDNVKHLANDYLKWLDYQDKPRPVVVPAPRQCGHISPGKSPCTLDEHPASERHFNDKHGTSWREGDFAAPRVIDKAVGVTPPAARCFIGNATSKHTACGEKVFEYDHGFAALRFTTLVREVTCHKCKVELGLVL